MRCRASLCAAPAMRTRIRRAAAHAEIVRPRAGAQGLFAYRLKSEAARLGLEFGEQRLGQRIGRLASGANLDRRQVAESAAPQLLGDLQVDVGLRGRAVAFPEFLV